MFKEMGDQVQMAVTPLRSYAGLATDLKQRVDGGDDAGPHLPTQEYIKYHSGHRGQFYGGTEPSSTCHGLCALYRKAIPVLGLARVSDFVAYNYFLALNTAHFFFQFGVKNQLSEARL